MSRANFDLPLVGIRPWKFPENERAAAQAINTALGMLGRYLARFDGAVRLFLGCQSLQIALPFLDPNRALYAEWKFIAARDGAMTIHHIRRTIELINANVGNAPTLAKLVSEPEMKRANRLAGANFRSSAKVRHGTAHSAEFALRGKTVISGAKAPGHVSLGMGAAYIAGESIIEDVFSTTIENEIVSYKINESTLRDLVEIVLAVKRAYAPAMQYSIHT